MITIILIILIIIILAGGYYYVWELKRGHLVELINKDNGWIELLNRIKVTIPELGKPVITTITVQEQTLVLELRLRTAGAEYCHKCGKVAGLRYLTPSGAKGLTIQKMNGTSYCPDCINKYNIKGDVKNEK